MKRLFILLFISLFLSSCTLIGKAIFKIDVRPNWKTIEKIETDILKQAIPLNQAYILDTASYYNSVYTTYNNRINNTDDSLLTLKYTMNKKNDLQPIQIRFFDTKGAPIFKMINCFIEFKKEYPWNVDNCFNTFPPSEIEELKQDINENLQYFLPHIKDLNGNALNLKNLPKSDYYAIVFWNEIMYGPKNDLFTQLYEYQSKFPDKQVKYIFVNNHNAVIWQLLSNKQKQKLKYSLNLKKTTI